MENKYKSVKISEELHKELKIYSAQNSLKLNNWIEELLKEKIKELKCQKN
jgi:predicted HicB family RNase H-like nuclease